MTRAHFDAASGASGNMILGALIDAGLDAGGLETELRKLDLTGWSIRLERVRRGSITALHLEFDITASGSGRTFREIDDLIEASAVGPAPKRRARDIFRRLAEAEARVHGVPVADVHFHEIGAADAILDIVGAAVAVELLGLGEISVSRINVGGGNVRASHGVLPVPAPATVQLLEGSGAPVYSTTEDAELLTPTGAAVLTSLAGAYGPLPPMRIHAHGYGAGTRELDRPNVLRVTLGQPDAERADTAMVIETHIDDMNPELYPYMVDRLLEAGALDAVTSAIGMKHGRPGTKLTVIAPPDRADAAIEILLAETTTLGVRVHEVIRTKLARHRFVVETAYGPIAVKASYLRGDLRDVAPEAADCARAAEARSTPLRAVYDAARAAGLDAAPAQAPDGTDRG